MPSLSDLPAPPAGRAGWPWTEAASPAPASDWPSLSVVTPSYNQASFLEETLRSVLAQGYPKLEYLVIDGGSTDGSVEIIRRYAAHLAGWVSERDRGQSDALNKGFQRATGEIVAWLNSDDTFVPGALHAQVGYLLDHPDVDLVYGDCLFTDAAGRPAQTAYGRPFSQLELLRFTIPYQPTVFMRRAAMLRAGWLDPDYHYSMDSEYWLRLHAAGARFAYHPRLIATYRLHGASKTMAGAAKKQADWERLIARYAPRAARAGLLADARLQTALDLALQRQFRTSWSFAARAGALRPRWVAYGLALLEGVTGLPAYTRWVAGRMQARRGG
jgi:glycosyltransferase involved in cell wall biosynthesis